MRMEHGKKDVPTIRPVRPFLPHGGSVVMESWMLRSCAFISHLQILLYEERTCV